jgi:hypothetical protein
MNADPGPDPQHWLREYNFKNIKMEASFKILFTIGGFYIHESHSKNF